MKHKDFEIPCKSHKNGLHEITVIKRWFMSDWIYCNACKVIFDNDKKICHPDNAPNDVSEVINRIERNDFKEAPYFRMDKTSLNK